MKTTFSYINLFVGVGGLVEPVDVIITSLGIVEEHCIAVYKEQEALSSLNLPEGNAYRDAILRSIYTERYKE